MTERLPLAFAVAAPILTAVLLALAVSGYGIPVLDDWLYGWSAMHFRDSLDVRLLDQVAPNAIIEAVLGGSVLRVFGGGFETLRTTSLMLSGIAGSFVAFSALTVGATPAWSGLLGVAYVTNPLMLALSSSFQTDAHAVALISVALVAFLRGMQTGSAPWLLIGGLASGAAYLSRPQTLAIPAAFFIAVALSKSLNRTRLIGLGLSTPAAILGVHQAWMRAASGMTPAQRLYSDLFFDRVLSGSPAVSFEIAFKSVALAGLLAFPVWLATVNKGSIEARSPRTLLFLLGIAGACIGVAGIPPEPTEWISLRGFMPVDTGFVGNRNTIVGPVGIAFFTGVSIVGSVATMLSSSSRMRALPAEERSFLVAAIGLSLLAMVPAALPHELVLNRYWLPLIPLLLLVFRREKPTKAALLTVSGVVVVSTLVAVAGIREGLATTDAAWRLAERTVQRGVDLADLDAGAAWDGWQFANQPVPPYDGDTQSVPWWIPLFAPRIDPRFVVALEVQCGAEVIERVSVHSLLRQSPVDVFLVQLPPGVELRDPARCGRSVPYR